MNLRIIRQILKLSFVGLLTLLMRQDYMKQNTIEKFTTATGIKKVVDTISEATGTDCGCGQRRDTLNRIFPYKR